MTYAPSITTDCDATIWAHDAVSTGFGTPTSYTVTVGDTAPAPYTPGDTITVPEDASTVTLHAYYDGVTFAHQIGQSRIKHEADCDVPPVEPEGPLVREGAPVVGDPDCVDLPGTVTTTVPLEAAGYYLGDDGEWHLGDYVATGDTIVSVREATAEECPIPVDPEDEAPEVVEPVTPTPDVEEPDAVEQEDVTEPVEEAPVEEAPADDATEETPAGPPFGCDDSGVFTSDCFVKSSDVTLTEACDEDATWWECELLPEGVPADATQVERPNETTQPATAVETTSATPAPVMLAETGTVDGIGVAIVSIALVVAGIAAVTASSMKRRSR